MIDPLIEFFRASYDELYYATFIVAMFLFLSGLDDLFIDVYYWFHHFFAREKFNRYQKDSPERLDGVPEKPTAIFVPAWHEWDVIGQMLTHAVNTIQYKNYDIFVGVYPNDPETIHKVEEVSKRFPNIHAVISDRPGPTTKADNLNQIHQGMLRWENKTGLRYDIIVMHDAEDIIHPLAKINNVSSRNMIWCRCRSIRSIRATPGPLDLLRQFANTTPGRAGPPVFQRFCSFGRRGDGVQPVDRGVHRHVVRPEHLQGEIADGGLRPGASPCSRQGEPAVRLQAVRHRLRNQGILPAFDEGLHPPEEPVDHGHLPSGVEDDRVEGEWPVPVHPLPGPEGDHGEHHQLLRLHRGVLPDGLRGDPFRISACRLRRSSSRGRCSGTSS